MAHTETRQVKARKSHRCLWCREQIEKGEVYSLTEWANEDEHGRNRKHLECQEAEDSPNVMEMVYDWYDYGCQYAFQRGHIHESNDTDEQCKACQKEAPC